MKSDYPWEEIKKEYFAGGISIQKLSEKYGVPYGTIKNRADKEQWTALREKTQEKINEKLTTSVSNAHIKKCEKITGKLLKHLEKATKELDMIAETPLVTKVEAIMPDGSKKVNVSYGTKRAIVTNKEELKTLTVILEKLYGVVRLQDADSTGAAGVQVTFIGDEEELTE